MKRRGCQIEKGTTGKIHRQGVAARHAALRAMRLQYPVACLCRMLKVSDSGFHVWTSRLPSERAKEEMRLELAIKAAHQRSRQKRKFKATTFSFERVRK